MEFFQSSIDEEFTFTAILKVSGVRGGGNEKRATLIKRNVSIAGKKPRQSLHGLRYSLLCFISILHRYDDVWCPHHQPSSRAAEQAKSRVHQLNAHRFKYQVRRSCQCGRAYDLNYQAALKSILSKLLYKQYTQSINIVIKYMFSSNSIKCSLITCDPTYIRTFHINGALCAHIFLNCSPLRKRKDFISWIRQIDLE